MSDSKEAWAVLDELPPFLTVEQAAQVLQLGRSKTYELTVEYEHSGGRSGLRFVRFGWQKRIPRTALEEFLQPSPPSAA